MRPAELKASLLHAIPVSGIVLGLFYYWFAAANRYAVFLYGHLGATPFDQITRSRYWMAGLVAGGAVLVLAVPANWLLAHQKIPTPRWWLIWIFSAPVIAPGIFFITMTFNQPTLPPQLATTCVLAALVGLALALSPIRLAAEQPVELLWLTVDGAGLVPVLIMFLAVELPERGSPDLQRVGIIIAAGSVVFSVLWLALMSVLRRARGWSNPGAIPLLLSGACLSYLLLPLVHHLFATPPAYRYITTSANFFANNWPVQIVIWLLAAGLAVAANRLRPYWGAGPGR